jgi:mannitol 2-dehydrogenase
VSLARVGDPDLAAWIDANCSFPNSMVDCIVPTTGRAEHDLVRDLGIEDANPVTHENFRQWVIEDDFCAGRPNLEKVGVTFTEDVHFYEALKIRILNGGHQILANAAEILSVETISEAMAHPRIGALFSKVAHREIVPHLTAVRDMAPADYVALIERRFANTRIVDTARRVAFDGSSRHPGFVIPTIRDGLAAGAQIDGLALAEAAWARMCEGTREDGSRIAPNDPAWEDLQDCATRAKDSPYLWLAQTQYYQDLGADTRFSKTFERWLGLIWSDGIDAAIRTYLVE